MRVMKFKPIGPGLAERTIVMRPKARLFTALSLIWCFVSPTPAELLIQREVPSDSPMGVFLWVIILVQPAFIIFALYFRFKERSRTFKQRMPDPNYGLRRFD